MVSLALDVPAAVVGGGCAFFTGRRDAGSRDARRAVGRRLAREALAALGGPVAEVGRDRFGAPVWPEGFTGSFSHSGDETAVLVARADRYLAVGLDWEVVGRIGVELWGAVFTPREVAFLRRMARPELATALFAAKEAVQKARYAASGSWTAVEGFEVALREERFGVRGDETLAGWFRGDGRRVVAACGIPFWGA